MKPRMWIFLIVILILTFNHYGYGYEETRNWQFTIQPRGMFSFNTMRGNIEVSTSSGNQVKIKIIAMAQHRFELEKELFTIESKNESVKMTSSRAFQDAQVDFDIFITVPEHLHSVEIITLNGEITARGTYPGTLFKTVTGDIDFKGNFTSGLFYSINGDINLFVKGVLSGPITADSTNGSIQVEINADSDFTVEGKTNTGSIHHEFQFTLEETLTGSTIKGQVNTGNHRVSLLSINGDIDILRQ